MKNPLVLLLASFFFALLFFSSITLLTLTFAPFLPAFVASIKPSDSSTIAQLPLSPDRIVPFSTPAPEIVVHPYPIQVPLTPAYNAAEARSNWIRIPKLNINVPVALSPTMKDADVITTLNTGAALYPNGVMPGALGNAFISAHSTGEPWKGAYRFAFIKINELKTGDALYVDWNGTRYAYRITGSEIITPTADFRVISDRPKPTISLMACWPLWSTKQRMLIHAELTNITQLTRPVAV
ncbi:MAG: class E sortase [Patescibacteria group bacterium]